MNFSWKSEALRLMLFVLILGLNFRGHSQAGNIQQQAKSAVSNQGEAPLNYPFMLKGFAPAFPDSMQVMVTAATNSGFRGPQGYTSNGQFLLLGMLPEPGIYNLIITNPKEKSQTRYFEMFLANEASAIRFNGTDGSFEVLEGQSLKAFAALIKDFGNDFQMLSQLNQLRQNQGSNADSINKAWDATLIKVTNNVDPFLDNFHNSPVAPFLLYTLWPITSDQVDRVEKWIEKVDSSALQNELGMALTESVKNERMFGYGQEAPNFVQNDPSGKAVQLKDFRGKYVLVDFWASWCGPCRLENPNLVSAFKKYKGKNFTVLGVSLDRDKMKWEQAIKDDNLTWTHVSDLGFWNNAAAKLYKVQSIPQNFLLDPQGKIIAKNLRGPALESFLKETLK